MSGHNDEWQNPLNWSGGPLPLYFCRADPRLWVSKPRPGLGWTLNLGHKYAGLVLLLMLIAPLLIVVAAIENG
jgi:uncharacterized membrane protein